MGITLDGIAKGLIVDWAAEELTRRGIDHFLINAGGDIRVAGGKGDGAPWRIAIRDPKSSDSYAAVIRLRDGAIATSGNYEVYFDREKLYHHIVSPWNGLSPRFLHQRFHPGFEGRGSGCIVHGCIRYGTRRRDCIHGAEVWGGKGL